MCIVLYICRYSISSFRGHLTIYQATPYYLPPYLPTSCTTHPLRLPDPYNSLNASILLLPSNTYCTWPHACKITKITIEYTMGKKLE